MITGFLFVVMMFITLTTVMVGAIFKSILFPHFGAGKKKRRKKEIIIEDYYNILHNKYIQEQRIL